MINVSIRPDQIKAVHQVEGDNGPWVGMIALANYLKANEVVFDAARPKEANPILRVDLFSQPQKCYCPINRGPIHLSNWVTPQVYEYCKANNVQFLFSMEYRDSVENINIHGFIHCASLKRYFEGDDSNDKSALKFQPIDHFIKLINGD